MYQSVRIVIVMAAVLALFLGLFGLLMLRTHKTIPGRRYWSVGNLLFAVCLPLLVLRQTLPDWISVVGANALMVVASILALEGTRAFRGVRRRIWAAYAGGVLVIFSLVYFTYVVNNLNARVSVMSLFLGSVLLLCSFNLLHEIPVEHKLGGWFTGVMFALSGAILIVRAIYFHFETPLNDLFAFSWANVVFTGGSVLSISCCSIGWLVLSNERLFDSMARRVAAADAAKDELVMVMNDEIRNPLSGIMAVTELLSDTPLTREQQEMILGARTGVEEALRVHDNLEDLSKIEAGKLILESTPFELRSVIESVANVYKPIATVKGLDLVVAYPDDLPCRFIGDPARLRLVIMNLVGSAVKFAPQGQIRIAANCEARDTVLASIRVSVYTSSKGQEEKMMARAQTRTPRTDESGSIGLSVSKKLIELMGGTLPGERRVGDGSELWFTLCLPLQTS